jgi:tRNA A-37 threonylcarbamoyl transferase component Bud32
VEAVVRTVPHQREVVRGTWQDQRGITQKVYAKKFTGTRAAQHFARDLSGVSDLIAANIPTPPLLYQGMAQDGAYLLIFAEIVDAPNAEQVWKNLNTNAFFYFAEKLVKAVAQHHNAGLLQADLHLKNFLVADNIIYTLDGDGIRPLSKLFRKSQTQRNLATLFSKMDVLDDDWMDKLYETYCHHGGIVYSLFDEAEIWLLTQKIRRQTASDYADKKVFRQCTDVNKYALEGAWILASSDIKNIDFTENLDALISAQNLLKNGNTCTVALVEIDDKKIVIKRYNIKNFWHGLSRALRQSRAAVSWANAHRLKILNIATAKPVALIEQLSLGVFRGKAYFLAEYIDAPDIAEYFAQTQNKIQRSEAIKNIVTLFYKLHLLQVSHGDMKATNIKMQGTQPVLIDLDSMRQHQWSYFAQKAHVRDLKRFMQNWQNDNALYNAFVKTFKVVYEDHALLIRAGIATNKELVIE